MAATISNPECFLHLAYHVFLPPQAPQTGLDQANERQVDSKISETVVESLRKYQAADEDNDFDGVIRMVDHVSRTIQSPLAQDSLCQDLANMDEDDTLVLYIRAQNAAVFIHKLENHTSFEIFGVQSPAADVMSTPGKLVRHYPEHAVEVPNQTANAAGFMTEIARFLAKMDIEEIQDAVSSTRKARSSAREIQDVTNPNYFIQLFLGMLRGMGTVVTPRRVVKRVADQVLWQDALKPWRRSPIWLIIRVALQMSLDPLVYKHFMAYCHAEILSQSHDDELFTSDLLYAMRVKAARRLYKLGESTPHFVLEAVMCSCFLQYHKAARNYYSVDVADRSVMVLTLLKIWVAIDKLATAACPLLLDFSPELADDLVDSLLLRTSQHIDQAKFVQEHIRARYDRVIAENDSVFADEPSDRNFGFQYFQRSPRLKALKTTIESDAQKKKDAKIRELHEKNTEYARLDRLARQTNHSFSETRTGRRKHDRRCQRCSYERSRDAMTIRPYEWPLPERPFEAEMAVFELDRPAAFTIWRDRTFALLVDVGSTTRRPKFTPHTTPDRYEGLESYVVAQAGFTPRITVGSSTKPYNQSNFYGISIPATEDQVCVNNTLKFQLYDRVQGTTAAGPFAGVSFAPFGTLKLGPTSVYRHIGYALEGTEHTSNQVLADQFDCPKELGLHEHYAFGTLRSGPNLQWMNILRGLEENILTFSAEEVYLLHTQAAWQLGPLSNEGYREWHEELDEEEFGTLLVAQSRKLLGRVMANWLEATSVLTVVQLVARLLSSWPPEAVLLDAYQFLREARQVTFNWLRELQAKLQAAEAEQDIIDYQFRVFEMAAICRSTFDVDPDHLANLLVTYDDVKEFIKCAVAVYENEPVDLGSAPRNIQVLACRDRRLSHLVAPSLLAMVRGDPRVLCEPLLDIWPDYSSATGWQVLAAPNSRWVSTTTLGGHGLLAQTVHLNLLEGRLLIDGMPLGRLPREYVKHATYIRLFGQKILDVVPASIPGMEFSTRDHIHGYQVSFVLGGERLLIQARKDGQTLELIPHWDLLSDFAEFFSTDYHHWANITTKNVEFRLLDHPWSSERAHRPWMLRFGQEGTTMENSANNSLLIDFHSPVFKSLARQFEPLEVPTHLHITSSHDEIEIELPRLKLSFFLNDNLQLESRNFRGQILDKDQSVGTLLGLKHQLVLCAKDPVAYSLPRSRDVLVPYGDVTFGKLEDHVSVEIGLGQGRHVPVYRYKVDEDLGYLASDAGLTSRLFKIYLHAITSHCLPDPLTGRTGTEEALSELSESATSSFNQIDVEQAKLLKLIGSLTPKRKYHPAQLKSMQTTHWVDLPILSQHYAFSTGVTAILRRADTLQMFYPLEFKLEDYVVVRDASLLQRSARQTSVYYPSDTTGYLAQILDEEALHDHSAPDSFAGDFASQGQLAAWASRLAFKNWGRPLFKSYNLVSMFQGWGNVEVSAEFGSLTYSSYWLHPTLSSSWMTMYDLCRRASTKGGKFGLVTFIATVAFGGQVPSELLPVLVAFGTNPAFRQLPLPSSLFYNLWDGYQPELFKVQQFVSESVRDMALTPANNLVRREEESHSGFARRKQAFYDAHTSGSENRFTQHLLNQWPSTDLNAPTGCSNWFFVDECIARATAYFSSCAKNVQLRHHLRQVEGALSARPDSQGTVFAPGTVERVERPLARPVPMDPWGELHLHNLMRARECPDPTEVFVFSKFPIQIQSRPPAATTRLANLFAEFQESQQPLNRRYGDELDESRRELDKKPRTTMPQDLPSSEQLVSNRKQCHKYLQEFYEILESSVGPLNRYQEVVAVSGLWPRITPRTLLQQMSLKSRRQMEDLQDWQEQIVGFAQVFVDYQRTQRLIALAESGSHEEFYKELDFSASGFEAETNDPDWLLVQIDGNFSARSVQRQVAHEMILPSSKSNTVLQLNMGEGKSSVIVPIISASLANTEQLVRVVVLKPLWRQMFHLLVNRLSGLANRRIYYLPFGRNMKLDSASADKLQALYTECMQEGGIMLAQPEHILSFKLMGIDQLISSTTSEEITAAYQLRLMQDWLTNHARDILDESDEILHVQYQLVYTVGEQQPLEDHPDRWITTQQILQLAATHIRQLSLTYSDSLKHESGDHGQFPAIRVMPQCDGSTEQQLILAVANDVLSGRIHSLNCARLPLAMREYVLGLLVNKTLEYSEYEYLRQQCDSAMWKGLLLVRGLLASGILVFALKNKHYRVDYGLDLSRSLLAVPYRAKVTKDRLLQGCMRMRKLGHGQSVMFAAPPEIDLQIRKAAPRPINARAKVDALDVLRWAMLGTCNDLYHHVSHWVQQGIEYNRRAKAQARYEESGNVSDLKNGWTKPEARPLEEMYGVTPSTDDSSEHCTFIQQALQVPSMRQRLETLSITHLQDPGMDEEQEREVSHEVEREQQIERPPKGAPATHSLHDDVKLFIESGTIPPSLSGIKPLFRPLSSIHPDRLKPWTRKLYASLDFLRTLAKQPSNQLGDYMRPVNWIVRGSDDVRLVLSPFEVNELLPFIRQSPDVQLHVYSPRVIQSMKSFSDLQFYSVPSESSLRRPAMPSRIQLQLDLFAGQLYLSNHEEYKLLCAILGLYIPSDDDQLNIQFGGDGFVQPEHREELANHYPEYSRCKFTDSPIPMLKDLVGRRRKEMKYLRTHIGQTLHGRSLTPADF
ncbi:hypothetical protein FRC11_014718 [Ceratobasidium sp. 423]|nr:hypothetical protein FRC11_014718 [Ceratobasidium sp. 423]